MNLINFLWVCEAFVNSQHEMKLLYQIILMLIRLLLVGGVVFIINFISTSSIFLCQ